MERSNLQHGMAQRDFSSSVGWHDINLPLHAFCSLYFTLVLPSLFALRGVSLENLLLRLLVTNVHPALGHSVPVRAAQRREELKDSLGFLLFLVGRGNPRGASLGYSALDFPNLLYYSPVGDSTPELGHDWASLGYQGILALEIGCSACHRTYSMFTLVQEAQL